MNGIERKFNPGNVVDQARRRKVELDLLRRREVYVGSLGDLSGSGGRLDEDIELIMGEGDMDDPENPFSGRRVIYPPLEVTIEGETFLLTDVGMDGNEVTFGLSATDGSAIFSRGKGRIGRDGIRMSGLDYLFQHTASNGIQTRIGRLRMVLPAGGWQDVPAWSFEFDEPTFNDAYRLLSRYVGPTGTPQGDFETDGLTYWQASGVTAELYPALKRAGVYGARITSPASNVQASGVYNGDFAITEVRPGYGYLQADGWTLSDYDNAAQAYGVAGLVGGVAALELDVAAGYAAEFFAACDAVALSGVHQSLRVTFEVKANFTADAENGRCVRVVWLDGEGGEVGRTTIFRRFGPEFGSGFEAVAAQAAIPVGAAGYRLEFVCERPATYATDLIVRDVEGCEYDTTPGSGTFSYLANVAAPTDGEYWFTMWVYVNGVSTPVSVRVDWENGSQEVVYQSGLVEKVFEDVDWEGATVAVEGPGSFNEQCYARVVFSFSWDTTPLDVCLDNLSFDRLQALVTQRLMFHNGGLYLDNAALCLEVMADEDVPTPGSGFQAIYPTAEGWHAKDAGGDVSAVGGGDELFSRFWLEGC